MHPACIFYTQFSTANPGTRRNSFSLFVTTVKYMIDIPRSIHRLPPAVFHEIVTELIQAVTEIFPRIRYGKKHNRVSYSLNLNLFPGKMELFR